MDSDVNQQNIQINSIEKHIHWARMITLLVVAVLSGTVFGSLGYFSGFSAGETQSKVLQNQLYTLLRAHPTPTMPFTATPTNFPTQLLSPTQNVTSKLATQGWKIYTSANEKVSFQYPLNWIFTPLKAGFPNGDSVSLKSPDRQVTLTWISFISGLGGGCDDTLPVGQDGACALFTLIDKRPILGAPGLYVISGILTQNGTTYQPFLAVQDNDPSSLLNTKRTMGYDIYSGRNNGGGSVIFSTSGDAYARGPELTKTDAQAWFNKPSVQQAKQILESLTY